MPLHALQHTPCSSQVNPARWFCLERCPRCQQEDLEIGFSVSGQQQTAEHTHSCECFDAFQGLRSGKSNKRRRRDQHPPHLLRTNRTLTRHSVAGGGCSRHVQYGEQPRSFRRPFQLNTREGINPLSMILER